MVSVDIMLCTCLTPNMQSAWYLLASGMTADFTNFWVVALRVSLACAKLSPHLSLRSSSGVLECRLDDKNVLGSPISVKMSACSYSWPFWDSLIWTFWGSFLSLPFWGFLIWPIWGSFLGNTIAATILSASCSEDSMAFYIFFWSTLSIVFAADAISLLFLFPHMLVLSAPSSVTQMLEISLLLKSFMSWTITYSPIVAARLSPTPGADPLEKQIEMADTFRPSISSCKPYLVGGNWIWWGFQWWRDVILMCEWASKYFCEGYHVPRKTMVTSDWRHAVNSESGMLISIGLLG